MLPINRFFVARADGSQYTRLVEQPVTRVNRGFLDTYPALGNAPFRLYWGGQAISLTGLWMQNLAQGWLILELTDSALMLGLVGAFWAAPNILLSLVGGVIADRVDRRRLLLFTRSAGIAASLTLASLIASGRVEVWHVFAIALVMGSVSAFDMPASQALVPSLVKPAHLMNAIALLSVAFNGTRIVGPSIAGVLVAEFGVAGCYFLAAILTVPVVGALGMIPSPPPSKAVRHGMLRDVASGLAYIRADGLRVTLLGLILVNSLFGMAYPAMMPVVARDVLGAGATGYGALMAASGVGSLIGTLGVATFSGLPRPGLVAVGGSLAFGTTLIAFGFSTSLPLSLFLLALVGLANSIYGTLISTLLQQSIDDEYRGRVMGVFMLLANTMAFAGLQAGALTTAFGVSVALAFNGGVVLLAGVLILALVPRIRTV